MLLQELNELNLQAGNKVKIIADVMWSNKEVPKIWTIKRIEEKVLAPNEKEYCIVNTKGYFLRISNILRIEPVK